MASRILNSSKKKLSLAYAEKPELQFRASNLFFICCASVFLIFLLLVLFAFENQGYLEHRAKVIFGALLLFIIGVFLGCIQLVLRARLAAARFIVVSLAVTAVLLAITLTGGFPQSVASSAVMIPIVMCYGVYGARGSLLMTLSIIGFLLLQWWTIATGLFNPPNFVSNASLEFNFVLVILATVAVTCSVLAIFDASSHLFIKRANVSMVSKTNFLANTSHEIRTPMNGIIGLSEVMMRTTELDADQKIYMEAIHRSGTALMTIINDILDYSRLDAGRLDLHETPFNLYMMIHEIRTLLTINAADKNVVFRVNYPDQSPQKFQGDAGRLRQVLINLVANAIKFTENGAITIDAKITENDGAATIRIDVSDTGIGIAPDKLSSIFERFTQAESGATQKYGGTGLGLSISQKLIELMGGDMGVNSTLDVGSNFWFEITLPLAETVASKHHSDETQSNPNREQVQSFTPPGTIQALIFSQSASFIQKYGAAFSHRGYRVFHTGDLNSQIQWLESLDDREALSSLIIVDNDLPKEQIEACCSATQKKCPSVKIIEGSAYDHAPEALFQSLARKISLV